jgi:hypothetical protein
MSDKRQKNQLVLAFAERDRSEAPKTFRPSLSRFPLFTSIRLVFLGCSAATRNPLNRPMRTRMSGGVAGESGRPLPLCRL